MEIGHIIRAKRRAKGLTQEQVAEALGVSAPAVSKWEGNLSFPDVTLLPRLARLLGTDLNGLMAFQEELSRQEVGGVPEPPGGPPRTGLSLAREKVGEYPNCALLALNVALALRACWPCTGRQAPAPGPERAGRGGFSPSMSGRRPARTGRWPTRPRPCWKPRGVSPVPKAPGTCWNDWGQA